MPKLKNSKGSAIKRSRWLPGLSHPLWCQRILSILPTTLLTARETIEFNHMKNNILIEIPHFNSQLMSVIHRTIRIPHIKVTKKLTLIIKWCSWHSMSNNSRWVKFLQRRLSNSKESLLSVVDSFSPPIRIYKISCRLRVRFKVTQDLSLYLRRLSALNRSLRLWLPGRCSSKPSSSLSTY